MKKLLIILGLIGVIAASCVLYILDDRTFQNHKYLLASKYFLGSDDKPVNLKEAVNIWTGLAEAGHVPSQCFLGFVYEKGYEDFLGEHGQTIAVNEDKAWHWAHEAAKGGCGLAQYQIGTWYQSYEDPEYIDDAIYWLTPLADWGYDNAQYNLGLALLNKDPQKAKEWLLRAARQGQEQAIKKLMEIDLKFKESDFENPVYEQASSKDSLDWMEYDPYLMMFFIIGSHIHHSDSSSS